MMLRLPFNFARVGNRYLVTNLSGNYEFVDSVDDFLSKDYESIPDNWFAKGFLAKTESHRNSIAKLQSSALSKRLSSAITRPYLFIVIPTLRCDHECKYCQVSRVSEKKAGFDLEIESIPHIVNKILQYGRPPFKIEFQGGEPLLRPDFITQFVEYWEYISAPENVEFVIATTLSQLTSEFAEWSKNRRISYSISLDGTPKIHDSNRLLATDSSHSKFINGLNILKEKEIDDRIGSVSTITKHSLSNPKDLLKAHKDIGINDFFARPLSPFGLSLKTYNELYDVEEFKSYYKDLLITMLEDPEYMHMREFSTLLLLDRIINKSVDKFVDLKTPSGHLMGAMIFNYNGLIYGSDEARMIDKQFNSTSLSDGSIYDEQTINTPKNKKLLANSFIHVQPGCNDCAYLPYCGSDLMHHVSTQGDPIGDKSISRFCEYQMAYFETIFELIQNSYHRKRLESWLR